jgi:hypothetical protein
LVIRRGLSTALRDVRNVSALPQADLVAGDPKSACPASADGALGDDATVLAAPVVDRRLLDHKRSLRDFDLKRGVVRSRAGRRSNRAASAS